MKYAFSAAKLIIAVLIFIFIFYRVGFASVTQVVAMANMLIYMAGFLVLISSLFLNTVNLKVIISPLGNIKFKHIFKNYLFSWALGLVTPGKVGEFSISVFLKDKIPIGRSAAVLMMERMITVLVLVLFSITGFFIFFDPLTAVLFVVFFLSAWIVGVGIIFSGFGRRIISKYVLRKYASVFEGFSATFIDYVRNRKRFVVFARCLLGGQNTITIGKPDSIRDFTHVFDMTQGYLLAAEKGRKGEPYNLGHGFGITIENLVKIASSLNGINPRIEIDQSRFRPAEVDILICDYSKAERDFGYRPRLPISVSIQDAVDFFKTNPHLLEVERH